MKKYIKPQTEEKAVMPMTLLEGTIYNEQGNNVQLSKTDIWQYEDEEEF